jgi:hypothetical protein
MGGHMQGQGGMGMGGHMQQQGQYGMGGGQHMQGHMGNQGGMGPGQMSGGHHPGMQQGPSQQQQGYPHPDNLEKLQKVSHSPHGQQINRYKCFIVTAAIKLVSI